MRTLRELLPKATIALVIAGAGAACAAAAAPGAGTGEPGQREAGAPISLRQESLVPPGYGTLKQDEVTVSLRSGGLLVKVTPLSEHVIRLLAPDTYTRLHGLAESRAPELTGSTVRTPELFLVSFFSYQPDVSFQPEDIQLMHQGQLLRPLAILPITSGWGSLRLRQQDNQSALFAFESPIDYDQPITLRYGPEEADGWRTILQVLRTERNKVLSRVGGTDG